MATLVVIPARWGSTRFPGKPLATVAGRSMVRRVFELACAAHTPEAVVVATDDERIVEHVMEFGGRAVRTSAACRNGSERALEAVRTLGGGFERVVNLQGDAVLTPPWVIAEVIATAEREPDAPIVTPAVRLSRPAFDALRAQKARGEVGGTTVVCRRDGYALYFSKSVIPFVREPIEPLPVFRHVGLYAYRIDALERLLQLEPGPLERCEQLEQLRALEHGIPIRVVEVDYRGRTHLAIDSPADLAEVERAIAREGELL